ncbi:hypothetical protein FACS189481_4380 [Clostridia bacterium]|nr:hypothetical protein FACS189481_4380 [Clostridia bacterium]
MNCKKKLQKILCIVLSVASVSSIIAPVSYADLKIGLKDGTQVLVVDPKYFDLVEENKETSSDTGLSRATVVAVAKYWNNIPKGDPCEIVVFNATTKNTQYLRRLLVIPFRPNDQEKQAKCKAVLEAYRSRGGYLPGKIVSEQSPKQVQLPGNTEGGTVVVVKEVVFEKDPIVVDARHQVGGNGLIDMNHDVVLKLVKLLGAENVRSLIGVAGLIYQWIKTTAGRRVLLVRFRDAVYWSAARCRRIFPRQLPEGENDGSALWAQAEVAVELFQDALISLLEVTCCKPWIKNGMDPAELDNAFKNNIAEEWSQGYNDFLKKEEEAEEKSWMRPSKPNLPIIKGLRYRLAHILKAADSTFFSMCWRMLHRGMAPSNVDITSRACPVWLLSSVCEKGLASNRSYVSAAVSSAILEAKRGFGALSNAAKWLFTANFLFELKELEGQTYG